MLPRRSGPLDPSGSAWCSSRACLPVAIPFSAFPEGQRDWLLWATTTDAGTGELIDHVGRANRTQLGRLDFLNTLPPSEHVTALDRKLRSGQKVAQVLMRVMDRIPGVGALSSAFEYVLQIRGYDVFPDVMFFTTRFSPGFPNGRRLEDDIVGRTCAQGDCALQEVAFIEGHWPRVVVNDAPFLDTFPYLAEPWPESPSDEPSPWDPFPWILAVSLLVVFDAPVLLLWLYLRRHRRPVEAPRILDNGAGPPSGSAGRTP